jgi:hypothetical protein
MLLSSIIAGTEINHGKGGFGNHSSVLVPLRSSMRASGPNQALESTATRRMFTFQVIKTGSVEAALALGGGRSACVSLDVDEAQCDEHVNAK